MPARPEQRGSADAPLLANREDSTSRRIGDWTPRFTRLRDSSQRFPFLEWGLSLIGVTEPGMIGRLEPVSEGFSVWRAGGGSRVHNDLAAGATSLGVSPG